MPNESKVSPTKIEESLKAIAEETLGQPVTFSDQPLSEQLDSMQRLSLMVAIEDHFEIIFDPEEEEELTDVSSLVELICHKCDSAS